MKIVLLGTQHPLQEASPRIKADVLNGFTDHLRAICASHAIAAIGEEMNLQTVNEWSGRPKRGSIPETVANEVGIPHRYCDPTQAERVLIGAVSIETDPSRRAFFELTDVPAEDLEAEQMIRYGRREEEWLRRVRAMDVWPLLFICGIDHLTTFSEKVVAEGLDLEVLPSYPIPEGAELQRPKPPDLSGGEKKTKP